jgi:hypothetical protein
MSSEHKSVVNHDDLIAVVSHFWNATRDDYVSHNTDRPCLADVTGFDDTHIFHHLAALAVACGLVESMQQVWVDVDRDYGFDAFRDDDNN